MRVGGETKLLCFLTNTCISINVVCDVFCKGGSKTKEWRWERKGGQVKLFKYASLLTKNTFSI